MNISLNNGPFSIFSQPAGKRLKSTEEKLERQQKAQSQIDFLEGRKTALKDMHCGTLDEIAEKLALFDSYEDQIAAVKQQHAREQMMHSLDEARELGERIAEAAKELEPKTAEERKAELIKEALGIEDDGGMLSELLEDMPDTETLDELALEELIKEELMEEGQTEQELEEEIVLADAAQTDAPADGVLKEDTLAEGALMEKVSIKDGEQAGDPEDLPDIVRQEQLRQRYLAGQRVPFDLKA